MFQVNDVILYGTQGVFQIADIQEKTVGAEKKHYYVLKAIHDGGCTIFAPTDNDHVRKKMRRLLTEPEILQLIDSMPDEDAAWIDNDNDRKEHYRKILACGDRRDLIQMIKSIYIRKKAREAEGKRIHMIDEHFFKDAEQILYHEFQYVLQIGSKEELMQFIFSRIERS